MLRTHVKPGSFVPLREPVSISGMEIPGGWSRATVPPAGRSVDMRCPAVPGVLISNLLLEAPREGSESGSDVGEIF